MKKEKIGFIGLGIMGKPMAKNLLNAGYSLTVHNRSPLPMEELMSLGALKANSPKETAENSDIIITMLPDSPDVEEVMLGKDGVLQGAGRGGIAAAPEGHGPRDGARQRQERGRRRGAPADGDGV
jgi:2-hydroxy-3-oxopropionate reductase